MQQNKKQIRQVRIVKLVNAYSYLNEQTLRYLIK